MKNYYIVELDGSYMNSFNTYSEACELRDELERLYKRNKITIRIETL